MAPLSEDSTSPEEDVNWDQMRGNWNQFKGEIREEWPELTPEDLDRIDGRRNRLVERIQERYGIASERAEREVRRWERSVMV